MLPTMKEASILLLKERLILFKNNRPLAAQSMGLSGTTVLNWIDTYDVLKEFRSNVHRRPHGSVKK